MQKQQVILLAGAVVLTLLLYFLGPTVDPGKKAPTPQAAAANEGFTIEAYRQFVFNQLGPDRKAYLEKLESSIAQAANTDGAHEYLHQLSGFFQDSVNDPTLHYFYEARLAELDNTEKSLTFAAHSILGYLPFERDHDQQHWLATLGKQLFEKALTINPANDSSAIGLGGCLMYGASDNAGGDAMAGIMKVREIAEKDSTNMFAQYMLGVGGVISKQFDRAVLRFEKVVNAQPENLEAMFKLAETYEMAGNSKQAADWYEKIYGKVTNPELKMELAKRIDKLRKG